MDEKTLKKISLVILILGSLILMVVIKLQSPHLVKTTRLEDKELSYFNASIERVVETKNGLLITVTRTCEQKIFFDNKEQDLKDLLVKGEVVELTGRANEGLFTANKIKLLSSNNKNLYNDTQQ